MDRTTRCNINKEKEHLNNTMNQLALTDIYNLTTPLPSIYHMLCHKKSLNTFKNIAVIQGIFSYHNGTENQ